jgi:hypothetical protein
MDVDVDLYGWTSEKWGLNLKGPFDHVISFWYPTLTISTPEIY